MVAAKLSDLRLRYLKSLPAPLDGMWECFVEMADHYSIHKDQKLIGYGVVNSENKLLQFELDSNLNCREVFSKFISELNVISAFVATCESQYLALCLDQQVSLVINALMYHWAPDEVVLAAELPQGASIRGMVGSELSNATEFGVASLGADPDWLRSYFAERIERREILGMWRDSTLIATGECRPSPTQVRFADLGVIVSPDIRGQGIATNFLRHLIQVCRAQGLEPICSTERENRSAQHAIEQAGFVSKYRILEIGLPSKTS